MAQELSRHNFKHPNFESGFFESHTGSQECRRLWFDE